MVRIRTFCQGSKTLVLALESMTFPPESPEVDAMQDFPDSPCEAEWARLWHSHPSPNRPAES